MLRDPRVRCFIFVLLSVLLTSCGADNGSGGGDINANNSTSNSNNTNPNNTTDTNNTNPNNTTDTNNTNPNNTTDTNNTNPNNTTDTNNTNSNNANSNIDTDGDGISDADEGGTSADFDGDGTPNYLDADSDNDGIPDSLEAGDDDPRTPPTDVDGDGSPDFLDLDSDGNEIPDSLEGAGDLDQDGLINSQDIDNDGDGLTDKVEALGETAGCPNALTGTPTEPLDYDGDGTPDYLDVDSDGDFISDDDEARADTDEDGCLDRYDSDSDNDSLLDQVEAGDQNPATAPQDTDGDGIPNYRDTDSDNDGLSDRSEYETYGTNPFSDDTDGDGVTDLIEVVAGTSPTNPADSPQSRGDFFFLVPHQSPPNPSSDTLSFSTNFQQADAYFLIDNTGSMAGEISAMHDAVVGIVDALTCLDYGIPCTSRGDCGASQACGIAGTCIEDPSLGGCIPSFWTGTGVYAGADASVPITNLQSINSNANSTKNAIPTTADGGGADEALYMATECMALGSGGGRCPSSEVAGCASSGIGCPGYRDSAARILILITDEDNQDADSSYTASIAGSALANPAQRISFVGIDANDVVFTVACENTCGPSGTEWNNDGECDDGGPGSIYSDCALGTDCGDCGTRSPSDTINADLIAIAQASGSVDASGNPFVRQGDAGLVVGSVTDAILEIVNNVPIRVTIEANEVPGDDGDALPFLDHLEITPVISAGCEDLNPKEDTNGDSFSDAFSSVTPGQKVCWDVHARFNDFHPPTSEPQVFKLQLVVKGDGAILDQRTVYFLVPPDGIDIN